MSEKNKFITESDRLGIMNFEQDWFTKFHKITKGIYSYSDLCFFNEVARYGFNNTVMSLETLEELLKRDKQREKDGFYKKIKIDRIPSSKGRVIIVPTTEESKLIHGSFEPLGESGQGTGGIGEGEEGEEVGEEPIENQPGDEGDGGAGEGDGEEHGIDADAYEYGKELTEKFQLPNLKDKGKKVAIDKYIYDLTDKHKGSGQILDEMDTLREILKTNLSLGRIPDVYNIDPSKLLISPDDYVFRVLSREKEYESQAIVFFGRDYSGSMWGKPAEVVVTQHLMLYSWLMYQYGKRVLTRFILNDTVAKEVPNFEVYYKSVVQGGTIISTAFALINKIITEENLSKDYNIYVFYGTDGDNWTDDNEKLIREIGSTLSFANRTGITIARNNWGGNEETGLEKSIKTSKIIEQKKQFRVFYLKAESAKDKDNIDAIKYLISE
jgi:uncharacterized protein